MALAARRGSKSANPPRILPPRPPGPDAPHAPLPPLPEATPEPAASIAPSALPVTEAATADAPAASTATPTAATAPTAPTVPTVPTAPAAPPAPWSGAPSGREPRPAQGTGPGVAAPPTRRAPGTPPVTTRDPFLDVIRGVATVRVVLWHMYGFAVLSYMFAAIPALFFVSGSLFGSSLLRRPLHTVVLDRFRRVLIPLWLFAVTAWALMAWVGHSGLVVAWERILPWFFPIVDPHGIGALGEWMASPLWFLRMLTWVMLLSPLLLRALDRFGVRALAAGPVAVLVCDWAARRSEVHLDASPRFWWFAGEIALYSTFFAVGLVHCRTRFRSISTRQWILLAVGFAALAVAWRITQPVPNGIVNDSQPLHLLVGAAWLSIAFAARGPITQFARRPVPSQFVTALSRRSFSIYLWHTLVIFAVLEFLEQYGSSVPWVNDVIYPVLVVLGIVVVTAAVGWVEDLAARRRPAITPVPVPAGRLRMAGVAMAGLVIAVVVALAVSPWGVQASQEEAAARVYRPRLPSQQPPAPRFVPGATDATQPTALPAATTAVSIAALQDAVKQFLADEEVPGVVVGVRSAQTGFEWTTAQGTTLEGATMRARDRLDIASATKVFTATLVMQQVDRGTIDLDAPLPELDAVPDFRYGELITPRMLLEHRSGLVDYRATAWWAEDQTTVATPVDAVRASNQMELMFDPGSETSYASVNYLVLGLLLEQVTGRSFDDLLTTQILQPLRLTRTVHLPSASAEPRGGAAGIQAPVSELLTAATDLLDRHSTLSNAAFAAMTAIDVDTGVGSGVGGYCPCTIAPDGTYNFFTIGMTGSATFFSFVPSLGVAVVVHVGDDLWTRPTRVFAVIDFVQRLAQITAGAPVAPPATPPASVAPSAPSAPVDALSAANEEATVETPVESAPVQEAPAATD